MSSQKTIDLPVIRDRIVAPDKRADVVFSGWRSRHSRGSDRGPASAPAGMGLDSSFPRLPPSPVVPPRKAVPEDTLNTTGLSSFAGYDHVTEHLVALHGRTPSEVRLVAGLRAAPLPSPPT